MPPVSSPFEETEAFSGHIYEQFRPAYARKGAQGGLWAAPGDRGARLCILGLRGNGDLCFGIHPGTPRNYWKDAGEWWELMFLIVCLYTRGLDTLKIDESLRKVSVKSSSSDYRDSVSMFQSIVDFVVRVGANRPAAERILLEAQELYTTAQGDYLERDYIEAKSDMAEALVVVSNAMDEATRAKERALTWTYVSEWMATMGVAMFSGVILWWLMVKRGLYREIETTELRQS